MVGPLLSARDTQLDVVIEKGANRILSICELKPEFPVGGTGVTTIENEPSICAADSRLAGGAIGFILRDVGPGWVPGEERLRHPGFTRTGDTDEHEEVNGAM